MEAPFPDLKTNISFQQTEGQDQDSFTDKLHKILKEYLLFFSKLLHNTEEERNL